MITHRIEVVCPALSAPSACLFKVSCDVCGTKTRVFEEDQTCGDEIKEGACSEEIRDITLHSDPESTDSSSVSSLTFGAEQDSHCSDSSSDDSHLPISLPLSDSLSDDAPWLAQWLADVMGNMLSEPACVATVGNECHTRGSRHNTDFLGRGFLVTF